jgi:O-methyltransferase involved in polyketide biosynthesis
MNQGKVKIKLSGVSQTLLAPLRGRAQVSKEHSSLFYDAKAIELGEKIEMDFDSSTSNTHFQVILFNAIRKLNLPGFDPGIFSALRAKQFDEKAKAFFTEHPHASVVNIGAGLDTTFYRVDNGLIHWYDLDLPEVIEVRRQLLPEPDRVTYIAKSLFDPSWCDDIKHTEDGVFMIAGGVFPWLEEAQVKQFFSMLADNFPGGEIVFDPPSKIGADLEAWINQFSKEQRAAVQTALMDAVKGWWEKTPQEQKDNMIAALKIPIKLKGKEWADIEAWLDQISDKEKEEAIVSFITYIRGFSKWTLRDDSEITKWDNRITVIDQVPTFKNVPRDGLSEDMRRFMDYSDESGRSSIIHLRV